MNTLIKKFASRRDAALYLMLLPAVLIAVVYSYIPMAGIIMAFERFSPAKGLFGKQRWVGLDNFKKLIDMPDTSQILMNTIVIALLKIISLLLIPILFSLLLNEIKNIYFKKTVQTIVFIPHLISWVIISSMMFEILSPSTGIVNSILKSIGVNPIFFLGDNHWFVPTMIVTNLWKECGYQSIIYIAAIVGINPELYEAATIDGAGKLKQALHITLPGISMVIILMMLLSLGNVLNAGFEQIFNMYNPMVYKTADIIDTFVYRVGILDGQYSLAAAIGLFKSFISFIFISAAYFMTYKFTDYRVF